MQVVVFVVGQTGLSGKGLDSERAETSFLPLTALLDEQMLLFEKNMLLS